MRISHSNHIPESVEYLGFNEWAVRWDVKIDNSKQEEDDITHYVYNEEVFYGEPNYDVFVSAYIRYKYTVDAEDALKSNIINVLLGNNVDNADTIRAEWNDFEMYRNEAKTIGRQIWQQ